MNKVWQRYKITPYTRIETFLLPKRRCANSLQPSFSHRSQLPHHVPHRCGLYIAGGDLQPSGLGRKFVQQGVLRAAANDVQPPDGVIQHRVQFTDGSGVALRQALQHAADRLAACEFAPNRREDGLLHRLRRSERAVVHIDERRILYFPRICGHGGPVVGTPLLG